MQQIMNFLVLLCVVAGAMAAPSRSPRFLFFNNMFPHHQQQQQSSFFYKLMPQLPHPLIRPHYPHQDPVDPLPYADYPMPPYHQPIPEPEPEPIHPYSAFNLRDNFIQPPPDHLEPPVAPPTRAGPVRIFYLFTRFPGPLEPLVQRVQNYFSVYTVPTQEPLLDEEVDLGPDIEAVDEFESQLSLAGTPNKNSSTPLTTQSTPTTTTTKADPTTTHATPTTTEAVKVEGIKPLILSSDGDEDSEVVKAEETSTEAEDDDTTESTTTAEESTTTTSPEVKTTTEAPATMAPKAKKITFSSVDTGRMLEDAYSADVLDYADEIILTS